MTTFNNNNNNLFGTSSNAALSSTGFGTTNGAPDAAASVTGFSFGGSAAAVPSTTGGTEASASLAATNPTNTTSSFGGFAFPAAAANSATTGGTDTSSAAAGNTFSTVTTTAPAPAPLFATVAAAISTNTTSSAAATSSTVASSTPTEPTEPSPVLVVPAFHELFPHYALLIRLRQIETVDIPDLLLNKIDHLVQPKPPQDVIPDTKLRQHLSQRPFVTLYSRTAGLTPLMLQEVWTLAGELGLTEPQVLALYAEASQSREWIQEHVLQERELQTDLTVPQAAKHLYRMQRQAHLQILLLLSQLQVTEMTDELLQKGLMNYLIQFISNLSQQLVRFEEPKTKLHRYWRDTLQHERQQAAETILYLCYSTQMEEREVLSLIQLVQTTAQPCLDPVQDVPDAYHASPQHPPTFPFTQALPPLREKTTWEWQDELIQQTKGDWLSSVMVPLVLAILCALDVQQELWNRETNETNGVGNAIYQSPGGPTAVVNALSNPDGWKRLDVWGVLAAANAVAMKQTGESPRAEIKRAFKAGIQAPWHNKSFTFLRIVLLPCIRRYKSKLDERCNLYEFGMTVLSEFTSHYLRAASEYLPLSRHEWEERENETLKMKREDQERAQSFYTTYGNGFENAAANREPIPSEANLLERPDCIDDIIALATSLCNRGPQYASKFWQQQDDKVVPSQVLNKLDALQEKDRSLIPSYVGFLAGLAVAEPSVVFDILDKPENETKMSWKTIFTTLRWYVRKMSDGYAGETSKSSSKDSSSATSSQPNSYYYGYDSRYDPDVSATEGSDSRRGGDNSGSSSQLKELGETNTSIVLSHLGVIAKVASNYATGRTLLAVMKLSLDDVVASTTNDEGDSVLVVLFSLAIAPLAPQVRGAVLSTIASLLNLSGANQDEECLICDMARKAWDLLDLSQTVPVLLLDQYQGQQERQSNQAMTFPPSSLSAASNGNQKSWLPADPKYGIIFEMEHIESRLGYYPSTEGLLQLLSALVTAAGCPANVGNDEEGNVGRLRPGCAPYIEYVVYFVLPRVVGTRKAPDDKLPFRTNVDSSRVLARALEVLEAVLTRYAIPSFATGGKVLVFVDELKHHKKAFALALSQFKLPEVTKKLMVTPTESDMNAFVMDFQGGQSTVPLSDAKSRVSLPRAKSPGFLLLADILASLESELLRVLALVLMQDQGSDGVSSFLGKTDLQYRVTWALFGDTPPSVATAKHKNESVPSLSKQSLLPVLFPPIDVTVGINDDLDPIFWKIRGVGSSIRILGAAAAREQKFVEALSGFATIVPSLQFTTKINVVQKKEFHLVRVRDSISPSAAPPLRCLPAIFQYLKSVSQDDEEDSSVSASALAVLLYYLGGSDVNAFLAALDAKSLSGEMRFSLAVADRLSISSKRSNVKIDANTAMVLLDLIQSELSHVLLGLPHSCVDGSVTEGLTSQPWQSTPSECLSVLLDRLSDDEFLRSSDSSAMASRCFEIICMLSSRREDSAIEKKRLEHVHMRLNEVDFWNITAQRLLTNREPARRSLLEEICFPESGEHIERAEHVIHGAAWFFDALASYFAIILHQQSHNLLSSQNQKLLTNLLDGELKLLCNALSCLPLNQSVMPRALLSLQKFIQSCMYESSTLDGRPGRYLLVNIAELKKKLEQHDKDGSLADQVVRGIEWSEKWNHHVKWECGASHLSNAVANAIEASLEYSSWTASSGTLHSSELVIARGQSLLHLLDLALQKLLEQDGVTSPMSSRLMKPSSIKLSAEVLLLVQRLLSNPENRPYVPYFVHKVGSAATSSLMQTSLDPSSSVEDEERSVLIGCAFANLVETDGLELQENNQDLICAVAEAFADLGCRRTNVEGCSADDLTRSLIALAARSILSSLILSLQSFLQVGISNPIVDALATRTSPTNSKTTLQALVQVIPTLDENICLLLESMVCASGGAAHLLKAGVVNALSAASFKYHQPDVTRGQSFASLNVNDPPSFLQSHMLLLRSLLTADDLSIEEKTSLRLETQRIILSYASVIEHVGVSFPIFGDTWLDFIQTLAAAVSSSNNPVRGSKVLLSEKTTALSLESNLNKILPFVVRLASNLIQYPFPERLLPLLPSRLGSVPEERVWWTSLNSDSSSSELQEENLFPDPPTGISFGWSKPDDNGDEPWTRQKYDTCLAAAQVVDASLAFLIERSNDRNVPIAFEALAIARGLCRLVDSSRAMSQRLVDYEKFSGGSAMDLGAFDGRSKESIETEKTLLIELVPLFERNTEQLLMLARNIFENMREVNEESFHGLPSVPTDAMKTFAEIVIVSLKYTGIENCSNEGSNFRRSMAKKLEEELNKVSKSTH